MTQSAAVTALTTTRWIGPASILLCLACLCYSVAVMWVGADDTLAAITRIGYAHLAAGIALCCATLLIRFTRWHCILLRLGHKVPACYNFRAYLAGLSLSSTPGKVGETMRSALLAPVNVPVHKSLAAFLADRLSDVVGVAALGVLASLIVSERVPALEAIAVLSGLGGLAVAWGLRVWSANALARSVRLPARWWGFAGPPLLAWAGLWRGWRPLGYAAMAMMAYGIQAAVFASYVARVAPDIDRFACLAMFCSATLIGAASLLPGGLGAMDSALVLQLTSRGVPWPDAVGATLATRVSTLWVAWLLGLAALATFMTTHPAPDALVQPPGNP